jgi:hypothetical protein
MGNYDPEIYTQLNERSRFYTKHIWQVPFAYVAIIAWAIEKLPSMEVPLRGMATIGLGVFTISALVFVLQMKYFERRAVAALQKFEQKQTIKAGGGSPWFFSFAWYILSMLVVATYSFFLMGFANLGIPTSWEWKVLSLAAIILSILLVAIFRYDRKRSRELIQQIREGM